MLKCYLSQQRFRRCWQHPDSRDTGVAHFPPNCGVGGFNEFARFSPVRVHRSTTSGGESAENGCGVFGGRRSGGPQRVQRKTRFWWVGKKFTVERKPTTTPTLELARCVDVSKGARGLGRTQSPRTFLRSWGKKERQRTRRVLRSSAQWHKVKMVIVAIVLPLPQFAFGQTRC